MKSEILYSSDLQKISCFENVHWDSVTWDGSFQSSSTCSCLRALHLCSLSFFTCLIPFNWVGHSLPFSLLRKLFHSKSGSPSYFLRLSLGLFCLEQTLPLVLCFVVCSIVQSKWIGFQLAKKENSRGIKEITIENYFFNSKYVLLILTAALSNFPRIKLNKFPRNLS